ncbi:MAG: coproporphyrinogen-III oxidase family protein, partial [Thioalkalivibrio sp.]
PYCDFNSHAAESIPEADYIDALIADLEADLPLVWGRRLESIFLGGGTPSLFSPEAIDHLLSAIRARLTCRPGIEITMEANPGTVEQYRIHTGDEAHRAVAAARAAGFDNLNLDLMFGLPGQSVEQALQDLNTALALQSEHLSWYELTLEPNTRFATHPPTLPDEDTQWAMQQAGDERLQAAGYVHYEVSAHALPGRECAHNLNYWHFGDYLGIGAGAHGKLTLPGEGRILRRWKRRQPWAFMEEARSGSAVAGERALTVADTAFEFMLNGLRLREGVTVEIFVAHTGLEPEVLEPIRGQAVERGLLADCQDRLVATELGRRYLNDLVGMFLEDHP